VYAIKFTDSLGDNFVVATETGESVSKGSDNDTRDASLYAYHYIISGDSVKLTWKLSDYIKDCPVDLAAEFYKNAFSITDIDSDGTAEIWLLYKLVCRGDVSPGTLKLFMYENGSKAGMRGTTKMQVGEHQFTGGNYSFDEPFNKRSQAFKDYAVALWKKNYLEKWE
jgi:hypothetical protein